MRRAGVALAFGLMCTAVGRTSAQQLRGSVRDSAAGIPLPGAVATVVDSAGRSVARTIADANGRFVLPLSAGAARVHVIRIGFLPRDMGIPAHAPAADVTVDVPMFHIPPVLEAVRVSDRELCPGSADRGSAFQLWEQARAGLLAAVVAREAKPADASMLMFQRTASATDDVVSRQTVGMKTGRTTRPFIAAAAPADFAARGYMQEDSTGRMFSAPDADVLLDESFAATHCFHLQEADAAHTDQIGLAFTPVAGRDDLVDVNGVIWIDRKAPALRSLDFYFTQLEPVATRAGVGGHIEFHTAPNGVAFIEWWSMRMPILEQLLGTRLSMRSASTTRRQDRNDVRIAAIQEAGGQVLDATWADSTSWHSDRSGVSGLVVQRVTNRPLANAIVAVAGTGDTAITNDRGEFSLTPLVPGRYTIVVADTTLQAFAAARLVSQVVGVERGRVTTMRAQLAPVGDVLADACRGQRAPDRSAALAGRVMLSDGTLPRDIDIRARWQADYNHGQAVAMGGSSGVSISESEQRIQPDPVGRFIVCGVALGRPVHLHLSWQTSFADTTIVAYDSAFTRVEWRPALQSVAAAAPSSPMASSKAAQSPATAPPASSGAGTSSAARAMEDRRRARPAAFVDDSVLRRVDGGRLGDVLRGRMPGFNFQTAATGTYVVSVRDQRSQSLSAPMTGMHSACYSTIYLDGVLQFELNDADPRDPPSIDGYSASQIAAVELYAVGTSSPAQYKSGPCGLVLLWSRDR